jgi:hypothetical protein
MGTGNKGRSEEAHPRIRGVMGYGCKQGFLYFGLAALLLMAGAGRVAGEEPATQVPDYIAMAPIMAPATAAGAAHRGGRGYRPVTVLLELPSADAFETTCGYMPRVRDVATRVLHENPVVFRADGSTNFRDVAGVMLEPVRDVLGEGTVSNVFMFEGVPELASLESRVNQEGFRRAPPAGHGKDDVAGGAGKTPEARSHVRHCFRREH